jgi:hypothetical protein
MIKPLQERKSKMVDEFYAMGGMSKFEKLSNKVAKQYEGKPVKSEYQDEYGKVYSGHIHIVQEINYFTFVGSPYHLDRNDVGNKKGNMNKELKIFFK